jgi:hypothetical protein
MTGANFAALHAGMMQRADRPAEDAAAPAKLSIRDGIYGAKSHAGDLANGHANAAVGAQPGTTPNDLDPAALAPPSWRKDRIGPKPDWLAPQKRLDATVAATGRADGSTVTTDPVVRQIPRVPLKSSFGKKPTADAQGNEATQDGTNAGGAVQDTHLSGKETPAPQKPKRKALTVRLQPHEHRRLKVASAFLDRTCQDIFMSAVDEYLKQLGFAKEQ